MSSARLAWISNVDAFVLLRFAIWRAEKVITTPGCLIDLLERGILRQPVPLHVSVARRGGSEPSRSGRIGADVVEGGSGVGEGHDYIQITVDLVGDPHHPLDRGYL